MDILVSSNLERYLFLASEGDFDLVRSLMQALKDDGAYTVPRDILETMQLRFAAYCADDADAVAAIGRVWREHGYLLDTHTAVAWAAMEKFRAEQDNKCATVVLATASPYKFSKDVLKALTDEIPADGFAAMEKLREITQVPVPANLSCLKGKPARFEDCIDREVMCEYVQKAVAE